MKELVLKLTKYISSLSFIDILFFCTVMVLIVLIVILISVLKSGDIKIEHISNNKEESEKEETIKDKIEEIKDDDSLDLIALTKEIEEKPNINIDLTSYEKEQEEKAIISYDELVKARSNYSINYEDEELVSDGVLVKKVDLENLTTPITEDEESNDIKSNITISYAHEEAFLQALQQLQEMLNS